MIPLDSVIATKEKDYLSLIKKINNILFILMIIFTIYYYLPENRLISGKDICSYHAIKENITCNCFSPYIIPTTFYPNGTIVKHIELKKGDDSLNVTG